MGLVKQVVTSLYKVTIKRLTKVLTKFCFIYGKSFAVESAL